MTDGLLISKARVKEFLRGLGLRVSPSFYEAYNEDLKNDLLRIAKRAKSNRRSTVMTSDA